MPEPALIFATGAFLCAFLAGWADDLMSHYHTVDLSDSEGLQLAGRCRVTDLCVCQTVIELPPEI